MKSRLACTVIAILCAIIAFYIVFEFQWSQDIKAIALYFVMSICVYLVYSISQIAKDEEHRATQDWLDWFWGE
jgi:ABC-type uncharacterized transport system permease subunit